LHISPMVSLYHWPYEKCSGLGGSGAYALLQGKDGFASELQNNVGWQDPVGDHGNGAYVSGRSGERPVWRQRSTHHSLRGKMATPSGPEPPMSQALADMKRDYDLLTRGSPNGAQGRIWPRDLDTLCEAIGITYDVQLKGRNAGSARHEGESRQVLRERPRRLTPCFSLTNVLAHRPPCRRNLTCGTSCSGHFMGYTMGGLVQMDGMSSMRLHRYSGSTTKESMA